MQKAANEAGDAARAGTLPARWYLEPDILALELDRALAEQAAVALEQGRIEEHAIALGDVQHRAQRHFDLAIDPLEFLVGGDLGAQRGLHVPHGEARGGQ